MPVRSATQNDIFGQLSESGPEPLAGPRPLADRLRPQSLDDVVGQDHLLGADGTSDTHAGAGLACLADPVGAAGLRQDHHRSPARRPLGLHFVQLSAVFSGVADLKRAFDEAARRRRTGQGTLLFVDEIHRFNRAQQDGFLPVVETGTITLIGATTENPSFALNGASAVALPGTGAAPTGRCCARTAADASRDGDRAGRCRSMPKRAPRLRAMADGDGRYVLNMAEQIFALPADTSRMDSAALAALLARRAALYDKDREEHYNLISALHKSLRGSDPDAALYWFARMLNGGEDPRYIARRLVRFAAEDIGMADPNALTQALAGWETYERLGSPEGELAIAQVVIYLGTAPKSNAVYTAYSGARASAKATGSLMPPAHILNAPTRLMKDLGYGAGYQYDQEAEEAFSGQNYFPDGMAREEFYRPRDRGFEREIARRLEYWSKLRVDRGTE